MEATPRLRHGIAAGSLGRIDVCFIIVYMCVTGVALPAGNAY